MQEIPLSAHCLDTATPLLADGVELGRPAAVYHYFLSLAAFSSQSAARMAGIPEYDIRRNMYNMSDFAHQFILNLWDGDEGTPMFSESVGYEYAIIQKAVVFMSAPGRCLERFLRVSCNCVCAPAGLWSCSNQLRFGWRSFMKWNKQWGYVEQLISRQGKPFIEKVSIHLSSFPPT